MATFKQDLLRSTFQQNQMDLLKSLDKNMSKVSDTTRDTNDFLEDRLLKSLDNMFRGLSNTILHQVDYSSSIKEFSRVIKNSADTQKASSDTIVDAIHDETESSKKHLSDVFGLLKGLKGLKLKDLKDLSKEGKIDKVYDTLSHNTGLSKDNLIDDLTKIGTSVSTSFDRSLSSVKDSLSKFANKIGLDVDTIIDNTKIYSSAYNTLIKNTGISGNAAQDLRGSILDTIKDLNEEYNGAFDPTESLNTIVALTASAQVRNPEFYEEFSDELLEANLSMNFNLATLAQFSDKFYRRYNFSSENMQSLLDNIGQNVAGSNVSEDELIKQIQDNEFIMSRWLTHQEGLDKGSKEYTDRQTEISNQLNDALSYATETGLTNTLSTIMTALEEGQSSSQYKMLMQTTGYSYDDLLSGYMTDASSLLHDISTKIENSGITRDYADSGFRSEYSSIYDTNVLKEVLTANTDMDPEAFAELKKQRKAAASLDEKVSDTYVSTEERLANKIESFYDDTFATFQEDTGISLSFIKDIFNLLVGVFGVVGAFKTSSFITTLLGGKSMGLLDALIGSGSSSLLGALGPALGVGGVLGVAAVVKGIYDSYKTVNKLDEQSVQSQNEALASIILNSSDEDLANSRIVNAGNYTTDDKGNIISTGETNYQLSDGTASADYDDLRVTSARNHYNDLITQSNEGNSGWTSFWTNTLSGVGRFLFNNEDEESRAITDFAHKTGLLDENVSYSRLNGKSGTEQAALRRAYYRDRWDNFVNELDVADKYLFAGYANSGLVNTEEDQVSLMNYWDRVVDLANQETPQIYVFENLKNFDDPNNFSDDVLGLTDTYKQYVSGKDTETPEETAEPVEGSYDVGTNYVPYDQLAYIHEGEAITPKQYNPAANVNELERLRKTNESNNSETLTTLQTMNKVVTSIQEFLEYWRQDNIDRETLAAVKASTSAINNNLTATMSGYTPY